MGEIKILLAVLIKKQKISHFHSAWPLALYCVVNYTHCSLVVYMDWCWRLWVSQVLECNNYYFCFSRVEKKGAKFRFWCGSCYQFEDITCNVNVSVDFDWLSVHRDNAKKKISTGPTTPPTRWKILSIGVNVEYHVGCAEVHDGFGVCGHVVK